MIWGFFIFRNFRKFNLFFVENEEGFIRFEFRKNILAAQPDFFPRGFPEKNNILVTKTIRNVMYNF